jgi:Uma2 family endonuclease
MSTAIKRTLPAIDSYPEEYLPESDGEPMAETDAHLNEMIALLDGLKEYFREDPLVYVTGDIFLYYFDEEGNRQSVSPDIFVVRGIEKKQRRIYNLEVEGKTPDVVIELTSISTKTEDLHTKRLIYAKLGVREYFLFDPYGETIRPALQGLRLENGAYSPMTGTRLHSEALGLDLTIEGGRLRLYDPNTGERLRTYEEAEARATALEAENLRLREELAKYQTKKS